MCAYRRNELGLKILFVTEKQLGYISCIHTHTYISIYMRIYIYTHAAYNGMYPNCLYIKHVSFTIPRTYLYSVPVKPCRYLDVKKIISA